MHSVVLLASFFMKADRHISRGNQERSIGGGEPVCGTSVLSDQFSCKPKL